MDCTVLNKRSRIVIFGAGELGRKTLNGLRSLGLSPVAFCDNNQELWDHSLAGIPVLSPADAAAFYGSDHLFVVCIWHPSRTGMRHHVRQLQQLGCRHIASFAQVFLSYPDTFLPHGLFESPQELYRDRESIAAALELFEGSDKEEFLRQLRLRFQGDLLGIGPPVPGTQYFPSDLIHVSEKECFVDCGAYDGDTLEQFLVACRGQFRQFFALEPDPTNFSALELRLLDKRITAYRMAAGSARGKAPFSALGNPGSSVAPDGNLSVDCISLDELLRGGDTPSYIKMDIEGHELEALEGARETIRHSKPKLAVCVYHKADHLWKVPLLMKELQPHATLHLRPHLADGWDLVCYSIPH